MTALKWILVAENAGARVFKTYGKSPDLNCVKEFDHPEGHFRNRDFETDRAGRSFDSKGSGRHAMSTEVGPKQHEQGRFAHELVRYLEKGLANREFAELVLVAPPRLLGELRQCLSEPLKKCVVETLDKDLSIKLPIRDVVERLKKALFVLQGIVAEG
jgi:protein required for attachment to host cells